MTEVMGTGLYNLEEAQEHPLWAQELYRPDAHVPETEEYGIISFVYRARAPFDPAKIHQFFNQEWPGVIRAKGFFGCHPDRTLLEKCRKLEPLSGTKVLVAGGLLFRRIVGLMTESLTL